MKEFENIEKMLVASLGLEEPWHVEKAEFDEKDKSAHVFIKARKTSEYPCPVCGAMCKRYDDEDVERVWRHGDMMFFPCLIHCKRPRVKCDKCGKIHVVNAPWARPRSGFTLLFESYAMLLCEKLPLNEAREFLRISHTALTRIVNHWVEKAVEKDDLSETQTVCIDETSFKRGQSYVTVVIDGDKRRVIDVEEGRSAEAVVKFSEKFEDKGGDCNKITQTASDMSVAFLSGIDLCFPNAVKVVDKFHVSKLMRDAMDKVRREEQGRHSRARGAGKKLLMIPETRMNDEQIAKITTLSKQYPKTGRAFRMVQALDSFYKAGDIYEAETLFNKLISWLKRSRLSPMKAAAKTLLYRKIEILSYFKHRLTNAIAEGINSLIQAGKRKARGFRTFKSYSNMIYLQCSHLRFSPIPLFL